MRQPFVLRSCFVGLAATAISGCTAGQVVWGGDPVENAEVTIESCEDGPFTTVTDENGFFVFDGHSDPDELIPEALVILITTMLPSGVEKLQLAPHEFSPCPNDPSKLCSLHFVDFGFVPMGGWEYHAWREHLEEQNEFARSDFINLCLNSP